MQTIIARGLNCSFMDSKKLWYAINCDPPRRQTLNIYTISHAAQIIEGFPRKWALVTVSV